MGRWPRRGHRCRRRRRRFTRTKRALAIAPCACCFPSPVQCRRDPDRPRLAYESAALEAWQTAHTPAVLALDERVGALLIEAIEPGTPLALSSTYPDLERQELRDIYRHEMHCQIMFDSLHTRPGWTTPYLLSIDGGAVGYGAVAHAGPWKDKPTIVEFFVLPERGSLTSSRTHR